jgi:hypothetical protein
MKTLKTLCYILLYIQLGCLIAGIYFLIRPNGDEVLGILIICLGIIYVPMNISNLRELKRIDVLLSSIED